MGFFVIRAAIHNYRYWLGLEDKSLDDDVSKKKSDKKKVYVDELQEVVQNQEFEKQNESLI
jgi:hypothetical protein